VRVLMMMLLLLLLLLLDCSLERPGFVEVRPWRPL
jgi:hypothetical protein